MEGHTDCVKSIARIGDNLLISGGSDKVVRVWEWKVRTLKS